VKGRAASGWAGGGLLIIDDRRSDILHFPATPPPTPTPPLPLTLSRHPLAIDATTVFQGQGTRSNR
jgi:hypothetical protein